MDLIEISADETVFRGKKQSIFRSYVYPLMDQPNLTVLTGAQQVYNP